MTQLERIRASSHTPGTHPLSHQTSPTFEQLLQAEETKWSPRSISPRVVFNSNQEEYLSPTGSSRRSSMLARVRERAKKLRHSLSSKRKFTSEINETHSTYPYPCPWGSSLSYVNHNNIEDNDEELEGDPEYLGAPMYESEAAPEILKENARQHPRAVPVILESHKTPNYVKGEEVAQQDDTTLDLINRTTSSKFSGLTIRTTEATNFAHGTASNAKRSVCDGQNSPNASSPRWDKGVSVKEYFMNKLEPGEDERALSHAITEAISPRKRGNGDPGVVQKVKGAVASLLWHQEPAISISKTAAAASSSRNSLSGQTWGRQNSSASACPSESYHSAHAHHNCSSPQIPVSYNAYKGIEEEHHGKILQAN